MSEVSCVCACTAASTLCQGYRLRVFCMLMQATLRHEWRHACGLEDFWHFIAYSRQVLWPPLATQF